MAPGHSQNSLHVALTDFKHATKVFTRKRLTLGPVLMAFENGFLSFESGEVTVVTRAEGVWEGRAVFSPEILRALATVPPDIDPIPIAYADGHLLLGCMTIPCQWSLPRQELAREIANPGLIDLLALGRTLTRSEVRGTELGKQIRNAEAKMERRIKCATEELMELEISEQEIRSMVAARIASRLKAR